MSCATCLKQLDYWQKFVYNKAVQNSISVFPICFSNDRFEGFKYLFESGELKHISIPLVLDYKNHFVEKNKVLLTKGVTTFLVDSNNFILYKGDPILNKSDEKTIIKLIQKL